MASFRVSLLGSFTSNDVNEAKYFKAVRLAGKAVLRHSILLIYGKKSNTNQGSMALDTYYKNELGWSQATIKRVFDKKEMLKIKYSPDNDNFDYDVSFYTKVIMKTDIADVLPDTVKDDICKLKNLRNFVCHEEVTIDDRDLVDRMSKLQSLCARIIEEVGVLTETDTTRFITELSHELDELLAAQAQSIVSDVQSFKQIRESQIGDLIKFGRKELKQAYAGLKILNPCCWLNDNKFQEYTVENVFTSLQVSNSATKVEMCNILDVDNKLKTRFVANFIILRGLMGSGKTSLCRYIIHEWRSYTATVNGLRDFDLLIFISIRQVACGTIQQYIQEQLMSSTTRGMNPDSVVSFLLDTNLLFVIDGYDEGNEKSKSLVAEIVAKFKYSKIIITSRPEFILDLELMTEDHVVIDIIGFDDSSIQQYTRKVMNTFEPDEDKRNKSTEEFLTFIFGIGNRLGDHLRLPLTTALLLILWHCDNNRVTNVTNATQLYREVFNLFIMKLVWRLKDKSHRHQIHIQNAVERWYKQLSSTAWQMLISDTLELRGELLRALERVAEEENIDAIETLSAFLKCEIHETVAGSLFSFSFLHNSAQEFLAAECLADMLVKQHEYDATLSQLDLNDQIYFDKMQKVNVLRLKEMIIFCAGILAEKKKINVGIAEYIVKCLLERVKVAINDTYTWYNLILESSIDPAICSAVAEVISSKGSWIIDFASKYQISKVHLNLLKFTSCSPAKLLVNVSFDKTASDIDHLEDLLKLIAVKKRTLVRLYFERQYNVVDDQEQMDSLVVPLLRSDLVVELKGHAGDELMKAMRDTTKLETLFLRVSSLPSLAEFSAYLRKHYVRQLISKFGKTRKYYLVFIELFFDILPFDSESNKLIPKLKYSGNFSLKIQNVSDDNISWLGDVICSLKSKYNTVILFKATVTYKGISKLLHIIKDVTVKELCVYSSYRLYQNERAEILSSTTKPLIRWSSLKDGKRSLP